jgi:DNA-binding PadR family transcriptional regulator
MDLELGQMSDPATEPLSNLEHYVLLALAGRVLYGYAIKQAVTAESVGALQPRAGSLYRVLARLMVRGFVQEVPPEPPAEPHPGLKRKYYALTQPGRAALRAEASRQREAARLAERRLRHVD